MTTTERSRVSAELTEVEFAITGMTCGSCAARVEKALSRQPGVASAGVNLASEKATVSFDPSVASGDDLVAACREPKDGAVLCEWLNDAWQSDPGDETQTNAVSEPSAPVK